MFRVLCQLVAMCHLSLSVNIKCHGCSPYSPQKLCFMYGGNSCLIVLWDPCSIPHETFLQLVNLRWIISPLWLCLLSSKQLRSKPHPYFGTRAPSYLCTHTALLSSFPSGSFDFCSNLQSRKCHRTWADALKITI